MLTAGTQLGSYRILCHLYKQTSGEVYRVKHIESERELALKVLSASNACDEQGFKLLKQQANELAHLSHKNILRIDEIGIENNICYTVSELIEGQTLQSKLSESSVDWKTAILWTIEIAEALDAAHSSGMVHGNLNPRNIYLTSNKSIKILDFGLARFIRPRVECIMNSVPYLSPEQVAGDDANIRSDIFALGCILYEMIIGRSPFARSSVFETVTAILKKEPQKLSELKKDVPLELDGIISHCLDKKSGVRYPSASNLIFELRQMLDCLGEGPALPRSRHFAAAFAAIVILIILLYLKLFNHT
jgi:eukaryotic-like serine/threonine-protein kinase